MNDLEKVFCIFAYIIFGMVTNIIVMAPLIKDFNNTKTNKIPLPLTIIILIITPFMYPILYIIFYGARFCWEFKEWLHDYNIKKRFHDYFNLD